MKKWLKSIADIQSGYYLRPDNAGEVTYLQAKYFDNFGDIKETLIPDVRYEHIQEKYLLKDGDILFSAKGTRNFAAIYKEGYGPCIASSTFFIIRLKDTNILPEYLAILINESQGTSYFKNNLSGGTIQSISKQVLGEFEIDIPPKIQQQQIIEIHKIYKNELHIYEKLKAKKEILINEIILHTNSKKHD